MENFRTYGSPPFRVALLHGGPGAPGQMAPVARELAADHGILEPLQTADTLNGQLHELHTTLVKHAQPPLTLVGSSWGALLGFLFTGRYPTFVKKLILIGCPPFEESYAAGIQPTRLQRLSAAERRELESLQTALNDPATPGKDALFARLGRLAAKADAYDPLTLDTEDLPPQYHIFQAVWPQAQHLRRSGELLRLALQIHCPVRALHGDHDPHPAAGVRDFLADSLTDFQFTLLEHCGHLPWIERRARDPFFQRLKNELP